MRIRFSDSSETIIKLAYQIALNFKHRRVSAEHVLYALVSLEGVQKIFGYVNADMKSLKNNLTEYLANFPSIVSDSQEDSYEFSELIKTNNYKYLMSYAQEHSVKATRAIVILLDLLFAFITLDIKGHADFSYSDYIDLKRLQIILKNNFELTNESQEAYNFSHITALLTDEFLKGFEKIDDNDNDNDNDDDDDDNDDYGDEEENLSKYLSQSPNITTDLCEQARQNSFDSFLGQHDILENIFEVLLRRKKNNVLVVGDSGVGKTAIVQEFANRLVAGTVPTPLQGLTLLSLDVISLVAGTRYRGDFEDRVKSLIDSISASKKNILFLDDIHSILNAGASTGNSNDFGDLIKPLLVDNIVRCIGTTTFEEFKLFEKEKTLLRRFNVVEMHEPQTKELFAILKMAKQNYEQHYNVTFPNEVLLDIMNLSNKYITERMFPDKALDILDIIGARLHVKHYKNNKSHSDESIIVTKQDVEDVISKVAKRPVASIRKDEKSNLASLPQMLSKNIFGQDIAISTLSKVIIRSRTGLRVSTKPIASLLFVGPTGVGKTELSKQLALEMGMHFQRYDMSEFQEQHTISKFIGSPPGYVGHDNGGVFIDTIRKHPHSVLLLDEIEKAHSDVFNLLLQVMDYATITDSTGRKADFRHVIIIMTSNVGAQESLKTMVGFEESKIKGNIEIKDSIKNIFSPEFINRLDEVIVFSPLAIKHMRAIVVKELKIIKKLLLQRNVILKWNAHIINYLIKKGGSINYGARGILRIIENEVKDKIAEYILKEDYESGKIVITLSMNKKVTESMKIKTFDEYEIMINILVDSPA